MRMPDKPSLLRRFEKGALESVVTPIIGILFGLLVSSFIIAQQGVSPFAAFRSLFQGAFGDWDSFTFTLLRFIPLAFSGLAVTLAYRGGIFNIGGEGQLYMGALASTWVAITFSGLPSILLVPLALLAGMTAGGIFAFIPGYLKAKRNFNEILITILLNYIGIYLVGMSVSTFLKQPDQTIPQSAMLAENAQIPTIFGSNYLHLGILLVFVAAALVYILLFKTQWGYEIRSVGMSEQGARYAGVNVARVMIVTMTCSGMLAALAGSMEILGVQHRLMENFMVGYGYDAIPVALLGGLHPVGTLVAALFFGALRNGANSMQIAVNIPVPIIYMVQGLAIIGILAVSSLRTIFFSNRRKGAATR